MYNSYQIPRNFSNSMNSSLESSMNNSMMSSSDYDNRIVGGGFLGPFILGGITGGLVSPFFYGNRPYYNNYYYYPYPPRPYYGPYYR